MAKEKKNISKHQVTGVAKEDVGAASKSIYQILNRHRASPYKTDSLADYTAELKAMTLIQLQDHAMFVGTVIPTDDRNRMIDKLVKEFAQHVSFTAQVANTSVAQASEQSKRDKSTQDILAKYRSVGA